MINMELIAAFDDNKGVGINNTLPWHIPEDLTHFKNVTMGSNMIMGKKTFDSLPGVLPGRKHIVLTRQKGVTSKNKNVIFVSSLQECISLIEKLENKKNIVIGGNAMWDIFYPYIQKFYITHVFGKFEVDTYFPKNIILENMNLISSRKTEKCEYFEYEK